jgi:spermidine synthase
MRKSTLYLLAFLEGCVLLTIELLAGQMLAPLYGASLFSWAAVIGVVVGCMAVGYFSAARLNPLKAKKAIDWILFGSAIYLLFLVFGFAFIEAALFDASHIFLSLFATVLIVAAVPAWLLAMLPPLLIHQLADYRISAGSASGKIFFISTLGAIAACFVSGFVLLPAFGILVTLKIAAVLLLWSAVLVAFRKQRVVSAVLLGIGLLVLAYPRKRPRSEYVKILEKSEGINGQLMVVDAPRGNVVGKNYARILFVNRMGQAFVDKHSGNPFWSYVDYMVYLCGAKVKSPRVLVLGLGGGTLPNRLIANLNAQVDIVEFDSRVVNVAQKYFGLNRRANITIDDARHFLNTCRKKYDYILFDLFKGEVPASHVLTAEALGKTRELLKEAGLAIVNYSGFITGEMGRDTRAVIKTMQEVFGAGACSVMFTPEKESARNSLIIGMKGNIDPGQSAINLTAYGKPVRYETDKFALSSLDLTADHLLTDNKPVLEYLHLKPGMSWRMDYYKDFTKLHLKQGIPLFD